MGRIAAEAQLDQRSEQGPVYSEQILAEFRKLQARHPAFASITLFWMQGERDAKTGLAAADERALTQLIAPGYNRVDLALGVERKLSGARNPPPAGFTPRAARASGGNAKATG